MDSGASGTAVYASLCISSSLSLSLSLLIPVTHSVVVVFLYFVILSALFSFLIRNRLCHGESGAMWWRWWGFWFCYLFFVVRLGDARLRDDLSCVDVARGQVSQLVHSGKSSLDGKKKRNVQKNNTQISPVCCGDKGELEKWDSLCSPLYADELRLEKQVWPGSSSLLVRHTHRRGVYKNI